MRVLGLDEAGRGPVLGPMVLGAVLVEGDGQAALYAMGAADSKALDRARREALYAEIAGRFAWDVVELAPAALEENLTQVELDGLAKLINKLRPQAVYLDAPVGPAAIPGFVRQLADRLDFQPQITAENRAEDRYPVVAAASIVAKVTRDRAMTALHARYGDIGWGYPAEPKTQAFLRRCADEGRFPDCVRTRWATVQRFKQRSLFDPPPPPPLKKGD
mgnify:CR=1 FL=1